MSRRLPTRRLPVLLAAAAALAGCAAHWERPLTADGSYCFRAGKASTPVCTPEPVPPAEADQAAKRFAPDPAHLVVYVVRHRWVDATHRVALFVDGQRVADTVPETFARIRLLPGRHELTLAGPDGRRSVWVEGAAGDVAFAQIEGSTWQWGAHHEWRLGDDTDARAKALHSRLVADVARL